VGEAVEGSWVMVPVGVLLLAIVAEGVTVPPLLAVGGSGVLVAPAELPPLVAGWMVAVTCTTAVPVGFAVEVVAGTPVEAGLVAGVAVTATSIIDVEAGTSVISVGACTCVFTSVGKASICALRFITNMPIKPMPIMKGKTTIMTAPITKLVEGACDLEFDFIRHSLINRFAQTVGQKHH
jgi:hypothetical protein